MVFENFSVDPNPNAIPDLWMMNSDGSGAELFLQKARDPSWGEPQAAPVHNTFLTLPLVD